MRKLFKIRILTLVVGLSLSLGVCVGLFTGSILPWGPSLANAVQTRTTKRFTLQVLDREQLMFLVTDRVVTQVIVEQDDHHLLLGERRGYLVATVHLLYGIDLAKLTNKAVTQDNGTVSITVHRPQILEFSVDPEIKILSKRTGLVVIADWITGKDLEDELRSRIKKEAILFVDEQNLAPDADTVLARLNRFAPALGDHVGWNIQFHYPLADVTAEMDSRE